MHGLIQSLRNKEVAQQLLSQEQSLRLSDIDKIKQLETTIAEIPEKKKSFWSQILVVNN